MDYFYSLFTHLDWRFYAVLLGITVFSIFVPNKYLKLFRSVRFNVWLFIAIAIASAVGSFYYPDVNIYHSWWFSAMLATMTFDVIVCKLVQKKPKPNNVSTQSVLSRAILKHELQSKLNFQKTQACVRAFFEDNKLKYKEKENLTVPRAPKKKGMAFIGGQHLYQRWGDFILHVSIVVILLGGLIGAMYGFEEMLLISEDTSYIMQNRDYEVELKDFQVEYYQTTGAPSLYASDLVVREKGQVIAEKRIVVNEPLDINRVRFYQASWGMTDDFRNAKVHMAGKVIDLKPREIYPLAGTPLSVRANIFYPTFGVNEKQQAFVVDSQGNNPALQIDFLKEEELQARVWILQNSPDLAYKVEGGQVSPTAPPPFFLVDVDPVLFSGVQVGYDPGAPVFWFGSILLIVGLCIHFYMHQRQLQIVLIPMSRGTKVLIGGSNSRPRAAFQAEFDDWVEDLRRHPGMS